MKKFSLIKHFKIFICFLVISFSALPIPQNTFAQLTGEVPALTPLPGSLDTKSFSQGKELNEQDLSVEDLLKAQQSKASQQQASNQEGTVSTQPQNESSTVQGDAVKQETTVSQDQAPTGEISGDEKALSEGQSLPSLEESASEGDALKISQPQASAEGEKSSQSQEDLSNKEGTSAQSDDALQPETTVSQDQSYQGESSAAVLNTDSEQPEAQSLQVDPNKEIVEMSATELDQLQEKIAQIDDPALKSEMLGVVAQEMQIVVVNEATDQNKTNGSDRAKIDITSEEGKNQALQQLDNNAATLMQNGVNQQTVSALKEAIASGDKSKVEALMSEMTQQMTLNQNGPNGAPMGDFDKALSMPVLEMMKDFGFNTPLEMGHMGNAGDIPQGMPMMEVMDFKDFYTGVRIEEMGFAMMEKGGFSQDQIDQFTDKAKQEFFNQQGGEGMLDPKMVFEGVFKEVFGQSPMMEGQGPMGPQGPEVFGPNASMEGTMHPVGPNGADFAFNGSGNFNFNDFLSQNNQMMGEFAFLANHEVFNQQGPNPQGFEGQGQLNGPGPFAGGPQGPGFEMFQGNPGAFPGGPWEGQGPMPGFDPSAGFQGPGDFYLNEGFHPGEFQAPEFQPPPEFSPPPPEGQQNPPPLHHHDLGEAPHVDGDEHVCTLPQCS